MFAGPIDYTVRRVNGNVADICVAFVAVAAADRVKALL